VYLPYWLLPILAAPFIGSFLGVVVRRLPEGRRIATGRSACDHCGAILGVRDLVPLASWAWNRGRCRHCGARLGLFFPAIELMALLVACAAASVDVAAGEGIARLAVDCALGWILLALAWIDAEHFLLPDVITLPLLAAGLAVTAWEAPELLPDRALGAAIGYVLFRGIAYLYRRWRGREGLGEGDAKLLAAAGAWLGAAALAWVILGAAAAGLLGAGVAVLAGRRLDAGTALPFGACLALAFFVLRLAGLAGFDLSPD